MESILWMKLIRRNLPLALAGTLLSCGGTSLPRDIKIDVPEGYRGHVHVTLCSNPPVSADARGNISVADCPVRSDRNQLMVTRGGTVLEIPPEKLQVGRTGDGLPVSIDADLP